MQHLNHVTRRGAVYVWRRRLPTGCRIDGDFIQISLRTRRFSTAKILANLVNKAFCDSILRVTTEKITRAEAQRFLNAIVSDELERIEANRYAEPQAETPHIWRERHLEERARAVALRKIAAMGPAAQLMDEDRAELCRQGVPAEEAERIEDQINALRSFPRKRLVWPAIQ